MLRELTRLREAISGLDNSRLERWFAAINRRCWQIARLPDEQRAQFNERARIALHTLQVALKNAKSINLGHPDLREPVQHFSFLAGWMAGQHLPISAALGLCQGMQEAFGERPLSFYDDLTLAVCEAYSHGLQSTIKAEHRQVVQRSQVVCVLGEKIVGAFLVADPDREALEDAIGRLMMLSIMRDARVIVVDGSGLANTETGCEEAARVMAGHRDAIGKRHVFFSGVSHELGRHLAQIARFQLTWFQRVDQALVAASEGP